MDRPILFYYVDIRNFLKDFVLYSKFKNPKWTLGLLSRKLQIQTSTLTRVLNGQREMGEVLRDKLITYLNFNSEEAEYFRDLSLVPQLASSSRATAALLESSAKTHSYGSVKPLSQSESNRMTKWYSFAIWLLARSEGFEPSAQWICERLHFSITVEEAQLTLDDLISSGLLTKDLTGKVVAKEGRIESTNDIPSAAIRAHHAQMMDLAKLSLETVPVEQREISGSTIMINSGNLDKAKNLIRAFRKKLGALMEEPSGDSVYQFNVQLFPLTKQVRAVSKLSRNGA